jgi:two-component system chemotaxis sensor kinase CheA
VALAMDGTPIATDAGATPVVRLRRERAVSASDTSVYRYDRPALIAALAASVGAV